MSPRARARAAAALLLCAVAASVSPAAAQAPPVSPVPPVAHRPVTIGSKPFGESYLLAEMFAQVLEARGIVVTRRFGLGGTEILFPAMVAGQIDVYPEYTGSGLRVILRQPPRQSSAEVFDLVSREFAARHDLRWLAPLGFENTYAMSVRADMAEQLGLRTLSDFAAVSERMRAGFTADFIGLDDGLPALRRVYGIAPREVNALAPAVKYEALVSGAVDIIDAYSTDGLLARYPVLVLEDDRHVFPPYDAAALVRGALFRVRPEVVAALSELSGRVDESRMRALNARVEVQGEDVARVAADALRELALVDAGQIAQPGQAGLPTAGARSGGTNGRASLASYLWAQRGARVAMAARHLLLVVLSLGLAILVAVPLGLLLERVRRAEGVIRGVGLLQTIPSLALLAFMIPLLGIGVVPAVAALFLYSLYPIVRNTYTGVREADAGAVAAGLALGMTQGQVLRLIRLPLAAPIIMAGIRTAAVLNVGTATLAALIGAGGLGDPIVAGLALADTRMILSGAIPAAGLALVVDALLGAVQRALSPRSA
jgi:osmoprotectant transport system permease protein